MEKFLGTLLGIGFVIVVVIITTPLHVFGGWVAGHIIKFFCGYFVANGMNMLFGTDRFTAEILPLIGGCLGFIGSFFKVSTSSSSKK